MPNDMWLAKKYIVFTLDMRNSEKAIRRVSHGLYDATIRLLYGVWSWRLQKAAGFPMPTFPSSTVDVYVLTFNKQG